MTSRLVISALVFSILCTAVLIGAADAKSVPTAAPATHFVHLEKVIVAAPRLMAKA